MELSENEREAFYRCMARIDEILVSEIFAPVNFIPPLRQSAFIELMICLYDLLKIGNKYKVRVKFTDAVEKNIQDVTELVRLVRNAACHVQSEENRLPVIGLIPILNTHYSKGAILRWYEGDQEYVLESEFDDDVCFFFGKYRIYLKRHIIRAIDEVSKNLHPFLSTSSEF